ncbi:MAG: methionyl-tRNA formyltransferase [Planctomycetaceae bacterium]|nr:methionyl-tRNA formyltransferase [Planctomycetaceae bacterium]
MRLILMGTGAFAIPAFQAVLASRHEVLALVTRSVPPAIGRHKGPVNPVLEMFAASGKPVLPLDNVNAAAAHDQLRQWAPDLFVVCDFGQILKPETLSIARCGGINLHGSLLPRYRGAAPVNWAIWQGETETGVTVIHITPRLDSGPCLTTARTQIAPGEDAPALERRLALMGVEPVLQAIDMLEAWDGQTPLGTPQDPAQATLAPRLQKAHGRVDWTRPAGDIVNQIRALRPWPGTYTHWLREQRPVRLILERAAVDERTTASEPGRVMRVDRQAIVVATGHQCLAIRQLQPAGKRILDAHEFLCGYPVQVGDSLGDSD